MTLRIAINGFGRIGRNTLRALYTGTYRQQLQVVAINDLGDSAINAHLLKYDSVHGIFDGEVEADADSLTINGDRIAVSAIRNPAELPWKDLQIDVVFECTGLFTDRDKAAAHLSAGARKVIISAPSKGADATIVYGVNDDSLRAHHQVISNASCTTNCLAPMAKVLHEAVGIRQGLVNTIHSYTNDQNLLDKTHSDLYRARAAALSMIPTSTGAAKAIGLVMPELIGRLDGLSVRVPTPNVSLVDLTFTSERPTSREAINAALQAGALQLPPGVMECNELALVSSDFNGYPVSCVVDLSHTRVQGDLVKVLAWYDNEWAFANRMLDVMLAWVKPEAR
jgi:glyceraldehyde 3-phosphate dehydrogenase